MIIMTAAAMACSDCKLQHGPAVMSFVHKECDGHHANTVSTGNT
jgi:hypothetical protein